MSEGCQNYTEPHAGHQKQGLIIHLIWIEMHWQLENIGGMPVPSF
jgi:hypothetical protein